eukprot:CAMPEP_0113499204 /NCGR_PEP_ID=MMETSP0014_2-20120614/31618_1 /TAXON_ID=2857 /ORGANISM="Nitzschia sp." /LENGTH=395 /DNA_ID=CAMNT_0000393353 /DNA_START=6 /DNA_END=1193 /DNA_ORIENTATION=+ /assembly_acc=CAM_ASM_000159
MSTVTPERETSQSPTKIKCRQCAGNHFTIRCPLRSPEESPKTWKERQDEFNRRLDNMPFKCEVRLHPGKVVHVHGSTIEEFWEEVKVAHDHSLYRDFLGVSKKDDVCTIYPPLFPALERGDYVLVGRTDAMSDEELLSVLADSVSALKHARPLSPESVKDVQSNLLLQFNHFSLSHEGNSLGLDEIRMLKKILATKNWKHMLESGEEKLDSEMLEVTGSTTDILEAVNHIAVTQRLAQITVDSGVSIDEDFILQLHQWVMDGLLKKFEEGTAGEYRKVSIGVHGSQKGRPPYTDVPPLMNHFFMKTLIRKEDEDIIDYLVRIHTVFQYIHPFRDGIGRIGRLIMNVVLMRSGYPVFVLPTTLSNMFNHGVEMAHRGQPSIFRRLLAESVFASLHA